MNYFELYDLSESFQIDLAVLKKKFLLLSKKYHPDFFTLTSDLDQEEALKMSVLNNEAYKTLKNEELLTSYILEINGIVTDEKESVPQDFLFEMMDINERLMEVQMDPNPESLSNIKNEIREIGGKIKQEQDELKTSYNVNNSEKSLLYSIKNLHLKSKYLSRLNERLATLG